MNRGFQPLYPQGALGGGGGEPVEVSPIKAKADLGSVSSTTSFDIQEYPEGASLTLTASVTINVTNLPTLAAGEHIEFRISIKNDDEFGFGISPSWGSMFDDSTAPTFDTTRYTTTEYHCLYGGAQTNGKILLGDGRVASYDAPS